ncbi:hypothetical protein BCR37DRAFT_388968 [Protomyces lactucae-debilis]|uniref:WD40-repeat-containing domain protein n=1 Tax=Protomyces lactucae-debilis TaxID=2754530 RepID=A0A1Y2F2Y2_PROLT|nr:uncharacterized protein BCR37DRAFT_388968 [Protomyces lactucae-debilis]ORY78250.1 hypothetical protein BCR37DRAFT_388968 [Protomyces lactucae-debilis]
MDFTPLVPASSIQSSACDLFVASVIFPSSLVVRSVATLGIARVISLEPNFTRNIIAMRWSPSTTGSSRILLVHSDKIVHIYDVMNQERCWTIDESESGIRHVEWSADGLDVLTWSDHHLYLSIWSLSGQGFVVPHPKAGSHSHSSRPGQPQQVAVLQREAQDQVSLASKASDGEWTIAHTFSIDTTDACGLAWSPSGKWLAVWDHPIEYRILIYTASGLLVRKYEAYDLGLGILSVVWSTDGEYLAVGSYDGRVRLLNTFTFAPTTEILHNELVRDPSIQAWREVFGATERRYDSAQAPMSLPTAKALPTELPKTGVSLLLFSPDGRHLVTRSDAMPTTLWIWSLAEMIPLALLVQLNAVKTVRWHPDESGLLVFSCQATDKTSNNSVYLWCCDWDTPRIVEIPQPDFNMQWFEVFADKHTLEAGMLFGGQGVVTMGYLVDETMTCIGTIEEAESEGEVDRQEPASLNTFNGTSSLIIHDTLPAAVRV